MHSRLRVGRAGAALVLATLIAIGGLAGSAVALSPSLSLSATTTVGDEPVDAIAHGAGQTAEIHLGYGGFGDGSHEVTLRLVGRDNGESAFIQSRRLEVTGDAGRRTIVLHEFFDLSDLQTGLRLELSAFATGVGPNGDEGVRAVLFIDLVPGTIYLDDPPDAPRIDRPTTVRYYGWGREPLLEGIGLYADRSPTGVDQGEDRRLATASVEPAESTFYEGEVEFVPGAALDEESEQLTLQARPLDPASDAPASNLQTLTANRPPVAAIDYSPKPPRVGEVATFSAAGSFDRDGAVERYQWEIVGHDQTSSSRQNVDRIFDAEQTLIVRLTVVDDDGASDVEELEVRVLPPADDGAPDALLLVLAGGAGLLGGLGLRGVLGRAVNRARKRLSRQSRERNRPPQGVVSYFPTSPRVNRPVLFDGSFSIDTDPGDRILSYRWTLGEQELEGPRFVHVFGAADDHDVTLTVTDTHGTVAERTETVTVEDPVGELVLDRVRPDAPGYDHLTPEEEYLVFRNAGDDPLALGGWTVHDAAEAEGRVRPGRHTYAFEAGFELAPDETVALHTGAEPGADGRWAEDAVDHRVFWAKRRAVWNNDGDLVVVEDPDGNPVVATRYERIDDGEYAIEELDAASLEAWFPTVAVTASQRGLAVDLGFGLPLGPLSGLGELLAGAVFRRGPTRFVVSWGAFTVVVGALAWLGDATGVSSLSAMGLLLPITLVLLFIGMGWLVLAKVVGGLRSRFGGPTQ